MQLRHFLVVKCISIVQLRKQATLTPLQLKSCLWLYIEIPETINFKYSYQLPAYVNLFKLETYVFFQQWEEALDLVRKAGNVRLFLVVKCIPIVQLRKQATSTLTPLQ